MFDYLNGKVTKTLINYIVIDINGIGFKVFTPNPYKFKEDKEYTIYIYSHIREDEYTLYGFENEEERELFFKLLGVKGVGPKMAMPILATGSISGIADAVERENILYLKKFPKIGEKLARQIILDLKGKLEVTNVREKDCDELVLALESLGYKQGDIKNVIVQVDSSLTIENQIKEALKLLLK
ncbi:MAG: Holliday junction branch migration protein RuvA [Tenericutes bacterium]|nr:Holliday junction branch migration protein RuvA [Mycoplasmatota bacterium]